MSDPERVYRRTRYYRPCDLRPPPPPDLPDARPRTSRSPWGVFLYDPRRKADTLLLSVRDEAVAREHVRRLNMKAPARVLYYTAQLKDA